MPATARRSALEAGVLVLLFAGAFFLARALASSPGASSPARPAPLATPSVKVHRLAGAVAVPALHHATRAQKAAGGSSASAPVATSSSTTATSTGSSSASPAPQQSSSPAPSTSKPQQKPSEKVGKVVITQ